MKRFLIATMVGFACFGGTLAFASSPPPNEMERPTRSIDARSAVHGGEWSDASVRWRSRYDPELVFFDTAGTWKLEFAAPLPRGTRITAVDPEVVLKPVSSDDGSITGVEFVCSAPECMTELETIIPMGDRIDPPLAREAPQRLVIDGARVRPSADSPLVLRLTSIRHRDVDGETVERLEERWGEADAQPVILVPDRAYVESGGLAPHVVGDREARGTRMAFLGGALLVVLAFLGGVLKLASRGARAEEAEAFLEEFELPSSAD